MLRIRNARPDDAEKLTEIYAHYVNKTAVSFEYTPPSTAQFLQRMQRIQEKYPYLVAEVEGRIVGYAYAAAFHSREAYAWAVETTIYLADEVRGRGIGRHLYTQLEYALKRQHVTNMNACIAWLNSEDEYLTHASVEFHTRMGFRIVGRFEKCGYKFGRWYDMVWMEKIIGDHPDTPISVCRFDENIDTCFDFCPD